MKGDGLLAKHRWKILFLIVAAVLSWWFFREHFTRDALIGFGKSLSPLGLIISFLFLPLLGFPFSVMLVLAGMRFGFWGGMSVAAVGVCFHNLLAYSIVHSWFRTRMREWLEARGYKVPAPAARNRVWFTALFAAVHGPPYIAKVYLLALTDIPLKIYLGIGAPVYIIFCAVPVGAGSAAFVVEPLWLYVFVAAMVALAFVGHWLAKRFANES